jgi:hypothetical protein
MFRRAKATDDTRTTTTLQAPVDASAIPRHTPTVQLGDVVRDRVTGFQGVIVARTEWLNGCWRITVTPPADKDGKLADSQTFDEFQLELVASTRHVPNKHTGGPREDALALRR